MLLYSLGNMVTVISDILRPELWSQNILQTENDTTFQTKHWCSAAQQATAERFVHLIDFGLLNELVEVSYNWGAYNLKIVQINEDEGKLALSSTKRNFLLTSLPLLLVPYKIHSLLLDFLIFFLHHRHHYHRIFIVLIKQWTLFLNLVNQSKSKTFISLKPV